MKTIITSPKGPPQRRVLCSLLFGAAAFCVVATNIRAAGPTPTPTPTPDIVWVTTGESVAKYYANGTAINTNFITEQPIPMPPFPRIKGHVWWPYLGGIVVSGPNLYVAVDWVPTLSIFDAVIYGLWWTWYITYDIGTYDAGTGNRTGGVAHYRFPPFPTPRLWQVHSLGPAGMALSGTNLYVANYIGDSITKGGNLYFIKSTVTKNPYALAVNGNVLYVTNNAQNSNGDFYISTYTADTGALITANFIQTPPVGLYGLALKNNVFGVNSALYVSVYSGNAPGVYTYDATTGKLLKGPFVTVNEPMGIAIGGSTRNTLYVASYQDSVIYEFDATTGAKLSDSIKVSAPRLITVEPATQQ